MKLISKYKPVGEVKASRDLADNATQFPSQYRTKENPEGMVTNKEWLNLEVKRIQKHGGKARILRTAKGQMYLATKIPMVLIGGEL